MAPSSVTGTNAAVSNQPFTFDDDVTVERPERLMVMTDGLNPMKPEDFDAIWEKLVCEPQVETSWLSEADEKAVFDDDDVTVVGVDLSIADIK